MWLSLRRYMHLDIRPRKYMHVYAKGCICKHLGYVPEHHVCIRDCHKNRLSVSMHVCKLCTCMYVPVHGFSHCLHVQRMRNFTTTLHVCSGCKFAIIFHVCTYCVCRECEILQRKLSEATSTFESAREQVLYVCVCVCEQVLYVCVYRYCMCVCM
jgi:hypothetical protein